MLDSLRVNEYFFFDCPKLARGFFLKKAGPSLSKLIRQIDQTIYAFIRKKEPASLYQPSRYLFDGGGKRLRAILLLLSSTLTGGDYRKALPAAAAVEILHNFSLIHDDIMDNDDLRRGRETIHKKWNAHIAILTGDFLAAAAFKALSQCPEKSLPEISGIFADSFVGLCEGQALDKEFETRDSVTERDYLKMITQKTAVLFSGAMEIGAKIGRAKPSQQRALREFGRHFGLAFQIQDDLLDIVAEEETLGKNIGSDLIEGKKTYVSILTAQLPDGKNWLAKFNSKNDADTHARILKQFIEFLRANGVYKETTRLIQSHIRIALKQLDIFKNHPAKTQLVEIAQFARIRKF